MGFLVILGFVAIMLVVGYVSMRKTRTVGDFFLGGRNIGPWISAFAYGTTYFSAVLFIGYAGKLGWGFGLHTMWIVLGNTLIGSLLAWRLLGKRTRDMTARLNAMTMPAFLAERYRSPMLKVAAALIIFVFMVPYSASVYMGLSYLFQEVLGMEYIAALAMLALLTGVYLVMGGYFAVTLMDTIMGVIMIFGVGIMVILLTSQGGGIVNTTQLLTNWEITSPALQPGPPGAIPGWVTLLSLVIITSLGPWGLPQMVQKFYAIKSSDQIKRAMVVATVFALIITFGSYYTGALTHLNLPGQAAASVSGADTMAVTMAPETSDSSALYASASDLPTRINADGSTTVDWDRWIPSFLMNNLPPWVMLVIALLVFSASMSTLSSLVLVSSSSIAMDLYAGAVHQTVEKKTILVMMRVLCGLFVLASLFIALLKPSYIINLMVVSWGVMAGSFAAPYVYGLFWRRTTTAGAIAGMLSGAGAAIGLYLILGEPGVPLGGAVGIVLPFIVVPVVSLLTKPFDRKHLDRVFTQSEEAQGAPSE